MAIGRTALNVGRRIDKYATRAAIGTAAAVGVGGAIIAGTTAHAVFRPDEKDTPWMDAIFEGVMGDPQADRAILGRDVGLNSLYALPSLNWGFSQDMHTLRNYGSTRTIGDVGMRSAMNQQRMGVGGLDDWTIQAAENNTTNGYSSQPMSSSGYPYRPRARRPSTNASGDIVLGSYNLRHGR